MAMVSLPRTLKLLEQVYLCGYWFAKDEVNQYWNGVQFKNLPEKSSTYWYSNTPKEYQFMSNVFVQGCLDGWRHSIEANNTGNK